MSIAGIFGLGAARLIAAGHSTIATVTAVKTCYWLKVNQKPVRAHALDGAVFPHIISFTYCVDGQQYTGSSYISWAALCPAVGEKITVYYDPAAPAKYALDK